MAHAEEQEERGRSRSQPHVKERGLQSPLHNLSSRFQRTLKKVKLTTPTSAKQDTPHPQTTDQLQKMQFGGLGKKKNQLSLTVATTDSTCTCTSSRSQDLHQSDENPISSSQQACSQINSDSMTTLNSFEANPTVPSDADLFNEWLQLHASSGEQATADTYDEADEQKDFFPFRATTTASYQYPREIQYKSRNEHNEMIYFDSQRDLNEMITYESRRELDEMISYWSPRDNLLSGTYSDSLVSPTDTAAATNNHIPTPPAMAGTPCSFNFDSFGLGMLKSVGELLIEGEDDDSSESDDDDDSSCAANSSIASM